MKRFLSQFLVITLLFSSMAWAANIHATAVFDHNGGQEQALQTTSQNDTIDVEMCDHVCHGATHLVGILCSIEHNYADATADLNQIYVNFSFSHTRTPPTPPPTA